MILTFWLFCAIATAIVASAKGRSTLGWLILGAMFGIFALIVIAVMPARPDYVVNARDYAPCPFCREMIHKQSRKCKHCHSGVTPIIIDEFDSPLKDMIAYARHVFGTADLDGTAKLCSYCQKTLRPEDTRCDHCKTLVRD